MHTAVSTFLIEHTRTKPRHRFTNGFVERLQGTILHEHWRVEFRGRTPAQIVWRALDANSKTVNTVSAQDTPAGQRPRSVCPPAS